MNRRGILGLFLGGAASAASGVKVKDAAAMLDSLPPSPEAPSHDLAVDGMQAGGVEQPRWLQSAYSALYRQQSRYRRDLRRMPAHIACMKSWSPAFKASEAEKEEAILDAIEERLRSDQAAARKIAQMMGIL